MINLENFSQYDALLGPREIHIAKREMVFMYIFLIFIVVMIFFLLYLSYTFAIPELFVKKNYWIIFFFLTLIVILFVPYLLVGKIKSMAKSLDEKKGFHWEGALLAKYKRGRDAFNIKFVLGDREFTVPIGWSEKVKLGDRICLVSMNDDELKNPTVVAYYPVSDDAKENWQSGGGRRMSLLNSVREENPVVFDHLIKVSGFRLKEVGSEIEPQTVKEFLQLVAPKL